jgi:cell division protein FtsA
MPRGRIISGIDIGTEKICTIIASVGEESGKTNVIGVASSASRGLKKSQIVDLEEAIGSITDSVEAAERMAGLNISQAYVSVSGAHVSSQNSKGVVAVSEPEGEITPLDVDRVIEAARAVSLPSSRELIHVIPRDFTVDSQTGIKDPVGMSGVRLEAEAHLVSGSTTALKNCTKAIQEVGIGVQGLVFSGLASSYAALSETEKELGVVLLDIGGGTTSLTVYVEGALAYSAVIPIGAKNITNDIAIGMRMSLQSAEKLKLHLSRTQQELPPPTGAKASEIAKLRKEFDTINLDKLGIKEEPATASRKALIEGIIRPRLVEIFSLVSAELKQAELLPLVPAGLVIAGGGAETVSILEVARRSLSLPARVGMPKGLSGLVDELASPAFATSTGLIHYALKQGGAGLAAPARSFTNPLLKYHLKVPIKKWLKCLKTSYHRLNHSLVLCHS